jgi:glycosyltransferase involved in cell wall biosynthesis
MAANLQTGQPHWTIRFAHRRSHNPVSSGRSKHDTFTILPPRGHIDPGVQRSCRTGCCSLPVFVIDDASTDDTAAVAEAAGATVLSLAAQLGAWGATQTGLRFALRQGFEFAITMDADGQHEASYIAALLAAVEGGAADVSIGAFTDRGSRARRIAWTLLRKSSGLTIDDVTSGFRAYNRRSIAVLADWRATLLDYQDIGVLLLLKSRGIRIVDVPVSMRARTDGPSRVFHSWFTVAYYMCSTLLLGMTKRQVIPYKGAEASPAGDQPW